MPMGVTCRPDDDTTAKNIANVTSSCVSQRLRHPTDGSHAISRWNFSIRFDDLSLMLPIESFRRPVETTRDLAKADLQSATESTYAEDAILGVLAQFSLPFRSGKMAGDAMRELLQQGCAALPFPGSGRTIERWRALSAVGALDLSLAKLYEGHTDAVAILAELNSDQPHGLSAVWAAESPQARVVFSDGRLSGLKAWCSGAEVVDHAVISSWTEAGEPMLAEVSLRQPGVTVQTGAWKAVGMAASESGTVAFDRARATAIGAPGDYVKRPGFWQGGAGIAAVWYGGAVAIGRALSASRRIENDAHSAVHLGAVDSALRGARALLVETAHWIDDHPKDDACAAALRVRAIVEAAANEVLARVGRALGPGPLCADAVHAQRCADLPVFLRQSHAEHDLEALGRAVAGDCSSWLL